MILSCLENEKLSKMPKVKNAELTVVERGKLLGLNLSESSMRKVSKILKIPYRIVQYTITHYSDDVKSALRSGRPKILDENDQKKLKEVVNKIIVFLQTR